MGHVYFDDERGWWICDYTDSTGRRRRVRGGRKERDARELLGLHEAEALRQQALGIKPLERVRFGEFADRFLNHAKTQSAVWKRYESCLRSLRPFFGDCYLMAIGAELIEDYKKRRAQSNGGEAEPQSAEAARATAGSEPTAPLNRVKPATVNRDLACLKRMFNVAIAWNCARDNPVRHVKFLREPSGRLRYFTREEFNRIMKYSPEHLRPILVVAVQTGLRQGELLALTWADVDLENHFASINDPKNSTPRKAKLNGLALSAVATLRGQSKCERVCCDETGKPMPSRTLLRQFKIAMAKAGVTGATFHTLRHTAASWMAMASVSLLMIKDALGHKDIRMTMRYAHLAPEASAMAMQKLEAFSLEIRA